MVFQVILIHFILVSTKSEMFQQMSQSVLQNDYDSIKNYFSRKTKTFLFHSESRIIPNAP
jgi:hypothetical protein